MFDKLEDLRIRLDEILNELQEPDVANDQNRFRKLMKEQNDLTPIVEAYNEYKECKQAIEDSLEMLEEESDEEMRELAKEELNDNKKRVEELEQELETLSHAEEIKGSLYKITRLLDGEEQGAVQLIKEALSTADSLERYYPKAKEIAERLRSAYIDMNDLASETEVLKEDIEFNPERLDWVNERLNTLYTLEQKHRVSKVEELMELLDKYNKQLKEIDSFDEQIESLKKQLEVSHQELLQQAAVLSEQRKIASKAIASQLVEMVVPLGMPNTRFAIDFVPKQEPESDGMDEIRFMFSANKSAELQPVAQTASGGEISRLMLCIKAMIAGFTALPAIIFDEVDTGVSGDIADKMGDIMQELGTKMQVFAITHLPQIAAKGKDHYFVYKEDTDERTVTRIRKMNKEERVKEIARMLSGASLTSASIANAKELLKSKI